MKHILARIEAFAIIPVETFKNKSIILLISSNIRRKKVNTRVNTIIELLQDREKFIKEIADDFDIESKLMDLFAISLAGFAAYGFIMGLSNSFIQGLSSMVKLPLLYIATTLICFPTFFIFYSLFGSKTTFMKSLTYLMTAVCVMSIILLAFAPVTLFFLLTSKNYVFYKLLNVLFFSVSGIVGISFFYKIIVSVDLKGSESMASTIASMPTVKTRNKILFFWMVLYSFVGTQLAWTLRPFVGAPNMPFQLLRKLGGNFYVDVFSSFLKLFS